MAHCSGHSAKETCIECEIPQLARNNYFTGKLLIERDFTDEQRYFIGKHRRHARLMHGWGTVCGLKVEQHTNPACRDQYVIINSGLAVDCCGREIIVGNQEPFDFRARLESNWKKQYGADAELDDLPHTLQVCIRYKECPSEEVPALFDECGCDDTACLPNRILEGFELDVLIDPTLKVKELCGPGLEWWNTLNVADTVRVAADEGNKKLYVLASGDKASLFVYNSENYSLSSASWTTAGQSRALDLALSPGGDRVYVAVEETGAADPRVVVLDSANLTEINQLAVTGGSGALVRLAVSTGGRLYVLSASAQEVTAWDDPDTGDASNLLGPVSISDPLHLVVSPDDAWVFVASSGATNISVINAANLTNAPSQADDTIDLAGGHAEALAIAETSAGTRLYIADKDNKTVRILGVDPGGPDPFPPVGSPLDLAPATPLDLTTSPAGRWIYALVLGADGKGYVQVIDSNKVETGEIGALADAELVGDQPLDIMIADQGKRLFAVFGGDPNTQGDGGVAIIKIDEEPCSSLFKKTIEYCPSCDNGECVVLATVKDYVAGQSITDALIDNFTDRQLLPSTSVIAEVIKCMIEKGIGVGEKGEQGPPGPAGLKGDKGDTGPAGPKGDKGEKGDTGSQGPKGDTGAQGDTGPQGDQGLQGIQGIQGLQGSQGAQGDQGIQGIQGLQGPQGDPGAGLNPNLPHILAITWNHGGNTPKATIDATGLIIAFDEPVLSATLNEHTVQVLVRHEEQDERFSRYCYCNVKGKITPLQEVIAECGKVDASKAKEANMAANAVRFDPMLGNEVKKWAPDKYRVVVKGDFILGEKEITLPDGTTVHPALDANHLGPGLLQFPAKGRCPTGDMVEGGTFESWFEIK